MRVQNLHNLVIMNPCLLVGEMRVLIHLSGRKKCTKILLGRVPSYSFFRSYRDFYQVDRIIQENNPSFASFVVARLLAPIDQLLRDRAAARLASGDPGDDTHGGILHLLSYVDDISICVYLPDLEFLCTTLQSHGTSLGCFINTSKTRILTSCNGLSQVQAITEANPTLGRSLATSIATFSNERDPSNPGITRPIVITKLFQKPIFLISRDLFFFR